MALCWGANLSATQNSLAWASKSKRERQSRSPATNSAGSDRGGSDRDVLRTLHRAAIRTGSHTDRDRGNRARTQKHPGGGAHLGLFDAGRLASRERADFGGQGGGSDQGRR